MPVCSAKQALVNSPITIQHKFKECPRAPALHKFIERSRAPVLHKFIERTRAHALLKRSQYHIFNSISVKCMIQCKKQQRRSRGRDKGCYNNSHVSIQILSVVYFLSLNFNFKINLHVFCLGEIQIGASTGKTKTKINMMMTSDS